MKPLTEEQQIAVMHPGNVLVTACPGSGKTRVLTYRVLRGLGELESSKHRVIAMTFTNRATDELQRRLDNLAIETKQLWAGTIHSFALDWIIRPYAPYDDELRRGFSVVDEFHAERSLRALRAEFGASRNLDIETGWDRSGQLKASAGIATQIVSEYKRQLRAAKLLDYDDILYSAYRLLKETPEIARTLSAILRLICVDEIQDTQDLQYGILSAIYCSTNDPPTLFFVGDHDQCIYESLGSVAKTAEQIAQEFELEHFDTLHLTGNYRSTQRIIDFYQKLRPHEKRIESLTKYKGERGRISFHNHTVHLTEVPAVVAGIIEESLNAQILPEEICVLAPQWWQVQALGRSLVRLLPNISFDAPGLSPLHAQKENVWFKLARLLLTSPTPGLYITRLRWAGELIRELRPLSEEWPETLGSSRQVLRFVNSIVSAHQDGIAFLEEAFDTFSAGIGLNLKNQKHLAASRQSFLEKARERINEIGDDALSSTSSFRRMFRHPAGVVVATCHAVKGEEYTTVVALGLLQGYIPNWRVIIDGTEQNAYEQASKLLYVIASRAKKRLHLISEAGRFTQSRNEYAPCTVLSRIEFDYDS